MGGYQCSAKSRCPCPRGRVVSRVTAFRHYREATRLERCLNPRLPRIISPPKPVDAFQSKSDCSSGENPESMNEGYVLRKIESSSENRSAVERKGVESDCEALEESFLQVSEQSKAESRVEASPNEIIYSMSENPTIEIGTFKRAEADEDFPSDNSLDACESGIGQYSNASLLMSSFEFTVSQARSIEESSSHRSQDSDVGALTSDIVPSKLQNFMENHAFVIGFAIKHGQVTNEMMSDLLVERGALYTSWSGLRASLIRESSLPLQIFPYCAQGHMALVSNNLEPIRKCSHLKCEVTPSPISFFCYIPIEDRLRARLKSKSGGPVLYEYFHKRIKNCSPGMTQGEFVDFTSGRIFKSIVEKLGGIRAVKDDIFLALSTDGVSAFKKTEYSYWPVVLMILNIDPSERFKVNNMQPVSVIPGPNAPTNLNSFLNPLMQELEKLSHGMDVVMWNGERRTIRVHLLFVMGDLAALKKLTNLKGYNALVPCRFCLIRGKYVAERRHVYYPPSFNATGDGNSVITTLWDPNNLPLRTPEGYISSISDLQKCAGSVTAKELGTKCQLMGVESPRMCELVKRMKCLEPFHGFPIDLMHLLFENIAPDMMSVWCGDIPECTDLSVLRAKPIQAEVSRRLKSAGSSFNDRIRRPQELEKRNRWKATEWKAFVMDLSLIVLDGLVLSTLLSGWRLFVDLCKILSSWTLLEREVSEIGYLSKKFYTHFLTVYYKGAPQRIHLCKYVYHLLLHLEDSVRSCGPLAYLSQWSVENFVGTHNRRCNSTFKVAESVLEKIKLFEATKMYCWQNNVALPLLDDSRKVIRNSVIRLSSKPGLEGYSFRHPKRVVTIADASRILRLDLRLLYLEYYSRLSLSEEAPHLDDESNLVLWKRMIDEKADDGYYNIYNAASFDHAREGSRSSCYVVGIYEGDSEQDIDFFYGKVLLFFEVPNLFSNDLLCLVAWAGSGLRRGVQNQVYKVGLDSEGSVFSNYTVESISTLSRQIAIVEQSVRIKNRRKPQSRTYFADALRDVWLKRESREGNSYRLRGLD